MRLLSGGFDFQSRRFHIIFLQFLWFSPAKKA